MKRIILLSFGGLLVVLIILYNLPESRQQIRSRHFTFIYSNSIDSASILTLARNLEGNYERISEQLNTVPANNIEVNIYASRWRYGKATGNWSASGSIEGISKLHFIEQAWVESDVSKIAVHEFTHAVVLKMLIDQERQPLDAKKFDARFATFPVWLWEAISCYEAGQNPDFKNESFMSGGRYPDLAELNDRSKGGKIYIVGYSLMNFMLQTFGKDKVIELIRNYGDIQKVLSITPEEFINQWHLFTKSHALFY